MELFEESYQTGQVLRDFAEQVWDAPLTTLGTLVSGPLERFHGVQQRANPYTTSPGNESFAFTWYVGYAVGQILLAYGGGFVLSRATIAARTLPYVGGYVAALQGAQVAAKGYTLQQLARVVGTVSRRFPDVDLDTSVGKARIRAASQVVRDLPTPATRRLFDRLDGEDGSRIRSWMVDADASPTRVASTLRTLRHTGDDGKRLLSRAIVRDREDLARWFVELKGRQAFQRRLATAYRNDEVTLQDIGDLQTRYDALGSDDRAAFRQLIDETGADGLGVASGTSTSGLRALVRLDDAGDDPDPNIVADGGERPATILLRADNNNADIDSGAIATKILRLENDDRARQIVSDHEADGARFVNHVADLRTEERQIAYSLERETGSDGVELYNGLDSTGKANLRQFVAGAPSGAPPYKLVQTVDDDVALRHLFEFDTEHASGMRNELAGRLAAGEVSERFVVEFSTDAQRLSNSGTDGIDNVFETVANAEQTDNIVGAADELHTAAGVEEGEIPTRDDDVAYVSRDIKDKNGEDIVDLDAGLSNGDIVESRGQVRGSSRLESKLDGFVEAHETGEIDLDGKEITIVSSNAPSDQIKTAIRDKARAIEDDSTNTINDLRVKFETR